MKLKPATANNKVSKAKHRRIHRVGEASSEARSPSCLLFNKSCLSCESNAQHECRFALEVDLSGLPSFAFSLSASNSQPSLSAAVTRQSTFRSDMHILNHATQSLASLLMPPNNSPSQDLIPHFDAFSVRLRPPDATFIQCDACDTFLFLDHARCLHCGQDFCLDCFLEWAMNPSCEQKNSKTTQSRIEATSKCSSRRKHCKQSFTFWTFITPKTRRDILEYNGYILGAFTNKETEKQQSLPLKLRSSSCTDEEIESAWACRVPILISDVSLIESWDPLCIAKSATSDDYIKVRSGNESTICYVRFSEFSEKVVSESLKGFDFPIYKKLETLLPNHWLEYKSKAPIPNILMNTGSSSLFSFLPPKAHSNLHGPTLFIGSETPPNHPTTRLHKDGAGAYNTLLHVSDPSKPGALWHIFTIQDTHKLELHFNDPKEGVFPLVDFSTFLGEKELNSLETEFGVKPIVIEQFLGDMILIPAGCAHQVRNLQLCVKVSQDVVTAECLEESIALEKLYRDLPVGHIRRTSSLATVGLALLAWERLSSGMFTAEGMVSTG
ncbi:hypothetical protein BDR26DRAFT_931548 [Obelidium mucronatum]|nr:hypothetical protein BDR26DRAFT_931548 [Obelidium mucronatum]